MITIDLEVTAQPMLDPGFALRKLAHSSLRVGTSRGS
jgi:hypothetical protein